jgi:hypothetical protein
LKAEIESLVGWFFLKLLQAWLRGAVFYLNGATPGAPLSVTSPPRAD